MGSPDPSPRASEPPGQGGEELGSPDPAPRASEPPGQDHTGRRPLHFVGGEDSSWLSMAGAPLAAAATSHEPGQPRLPAPCWSSLKRRPCRFLRCECFTCSCVLIAMGQGMRGGPDPPVVILRCTGGVRSWDPPTLPPELRSRLARGVRSWDPPTLPPELRSRLARTTRGVDHCISWAARIAHGSAWRAPRWPLQPPATSQASPASQHPAGRRSSDGLVGS